MDISWFGLSCFRLRDRTASVVTDPYGKNLGLLLPRVRADVITISHADAGHNNAKGAKGDFKVIDGPGEYEVSGVFITGLELRGERRKRKTDQAELLNTVFLFEFDDLSVCHLGGLDHVPSQAQVEESLEAVDVLLVPVGGGAALNAAQAAEVVSLLEPRLVVPMHYRLPGLTVRLDPVDKFLREMGLGAIPAQETLKVSRSGLGEETQVVVLESRNKEEES